jgi:hypothetical protein
MAKYVSDFVGKSYPYLAGAGLEFELLHILGSRFISPAEQRSQSGQKSKPRTFFVMRNHKLFYYK